jgi:hypothetical protein
MNARKIFALCLLSLGLWACHQPGPAERAGERVDAITGNDDRAAQKAGRNVDEAVDDVRDGVKKARKDLED